MSRWDKLNAQRIKMAEKRGVGTHSFEYSLFI